MDQRVFDIITSAQCRMARAALGWSVADTVEVSRVSRSSIARLESGDEIRPLLHRALKAAFEKNGVKFTDNGVEVVNGESVA